MTLTIADDRMTCDVSTHYAFRVRDSWQVSWLGAGYRLDRNGAITAMTIAETLGHQPRTAIETASAKERLLLASLASELDVTLNEAVALIAIPVAEVTG